MKEQGDFKELIEKAKHGDSAAFSTLYEYYLTPIFRFVYFRVRSKEDAEDLTQHIFAKAWSALPDYRQEGKGFSAWLYRIARNTTIDYWRKRKDIQVDPSSSVFQKREDAAPSPHESALQKEEFELVKDAIHILAEEQQTVILLKFIEQLSNKEIADITGKSEGAVRQAQSRGLRALRQYFQQNNLL